MRRPGAAERFGMKILQINTVYGEGSTGGIVRDLHDLCADGVDDLHIARRDAVVNDGGHQLRDDHFHDDLRDHKDRRQHGDQAEALGFTSECF